MLGRRLAITLAGATLAASPLLAASGVFVGERPLLRIRWPATLAGTAVNVVPTEAIVGSDGRVIRFESHPGVPFLLQRFEHSAHDFGLLQSELERYKVAGLSQTCRFDEPIAGELDRLIVATAGEPVRLVWYGAASKRTSEIVVTVNPARPRCAIEPLNVLRAALQYLGAVGRTPPSFSTGFLSRLAGGQRQLSGRVRCDADGPGVAARVQLTDEEPVECWPEICFRLKPTVLAETTSGADGSFRIALPASTPARAWLFAEPTASCEYEFGYLLVPPEPTNEIELPIDWIWNPPG